LKIRDAIWAADSLREEFIAANPDLLDKNILLRWYSKQQLDSQLARTTFVLPRPFQSSD